MAELELGPLLATPVRQLSLGQRMRAELTAALLHDPEILYLDEPTIGLDVVSKAAVRDFLLDVNRTRGVTILLTTHDLADIERLCSRVVVIDHGRIIHDGTVADIKTRFGDQRTLVVDLAEPAAPLDIHAAEVIRVEGPRATHDPRREFRTRHGRRESARPRRFTLPDAGRDRQGPRRSAGMSTIVASTDACGATDSATHHRVCRSRSCPRRGAVERITLAGGERMLRSGSASGAWGVW